MMANHKRKLVYGVGVNDAPYHDKNCPFLIVWRAMLRRCYSTETNRYQGVYVADEWLTFMNFRSWMETKDWKGNYLDKDLKVYNSDRYSPETCMFIPGWLNSTFKRSPIVGPYLLGTGLRPSGKWAATGFNCFHVGMFESEIDAHHAAVEDRMKDLLIKAESIVDYEIKSAIINRAELIRSIIKSGGIIERI